MKKTVTIIFVLLLLIAANTGCGNTSDNSVNDLPYDFNFNIDFGVLGRNNIDTYNSTFTKDLIV